MPKRREPSAYPRVNNHQTFSTFRLIPVINQKNYFTNYLKKDSQYMCRYIRERTEEDESRVVVLQLGSRNLRIGLSSDAQPHCMPFNVAKHQPLYGETPSKTPGEMRGETERFDAALGEVTQSFVDRMKFYKTRIVGDAKSTCEQFNARQRGEPMAVHGDDAAASKNGGSAKQFCVSEAPQDYNLFWPLERGVLNEDPAFYRSPQELVADIYDILDYALHKLGIDLRPKRVKTEASTDADGVKTEAKSDATSRSVSSSVSEMFGDEDTSASSTASPKPTGSGDAYDVVLVIGDLTERSALAPIVDVLFTLGFANVALIEEAVAATYGAGISAACVVDIGAQTTTVSCVDDGACVADSRVKLDYGSEDITRAWGRLLERISFPGNPGFGALDQLKQRFCTVNEADISVQLYQYVNQAHHRKYDFKVYNEVMLPVIGLFYPDLFTLPAARPWRHTLFPAAVDAYTGHASDPVSDADINVRLGTLAVLGQSYEAAASASTSASNTSSGQPTNGQPTNGQPSNGQPTNGQPLNGQPTNGAGSVGALGDDDMSVLDVDDDDEMSRDGTPAVSATAKQGETLSQLKVFESLDRTRLAVAPLDHAIIESITQACKSSGTSLRQYYENLLVIGGGSKVPSFHAMLTDRLVMWNQSRAKELGDVSVMAMPRDMDAESICWRGGSVYSKLKIIDEMWTSKHEWDTLGARTLHYKAALYMY